MQKFKPEAVYFSTIRAFTVLLVNIEDPHVELRKLFTVLSKYGNVTCGCISLR